MILPSNDLLSEVLKHDYSERLFTIISIEDNNLVGRYDCGSGEPTGLGYEINIYELMHLMKEWTYKYGHEMVSYHIQDSNEWRCLYAHISIDLNIDKRVGFYAETEFEAVTKACEYILEQLKDK